MTKDRGAELVEESEIELERALRDSVGDPEEANAALTRLAHAFDGRRRRREAVAIAGTATGAARAARRSA